jgi:hypothetical protein
VASFYRHTQIPPSLSALLKSAWIFAMQSSPELPGRPSPLDCLSLISYSRKIAHPRHHSSISELLVSMDAEDHSTFIGALIRLVSSGFENRGDGQHISANLYTDGKISINFLEHLKPGMIPNDGIQRHHLWLRFWHRFKRR